MEIRDYIESGKLELYVYGALNQEEAAEVARMARDHQEIRNEIEEIERTIVSLSSGFAPFLPTGTFSSVREKVKFKGKKRSSGVWATVGWTIAILALGASGYLFFQHSELRMQYVNAVTTHDRLRDSIVNLETAQLRTQYALGAVRDINNRVITLGGQPAAPAAFSKIYWNLQTRAVFVDAAGLPEPAENHEYHVWAFQYRPFRVTSVGAISDFHSNAEKIFLAGNATEAEAFGITLESDPGVEDPTLEQLYVIGRAD